MGDIDDLYKQEAENIDLEFLEGLEKSKDHIKDIEKYRENLRKARLKFSNDYTKFNDAEKKRIHNMKKKIDGMPEFKHLEISHFDFEFGFWERLKLRWDVRFFNLGRKFRRFFFWIFPNWFIYGWYKIKNFIKSLWGDLMEVLGAAWDRVKNSYIKFIDWGIELLKQTWTWIINLSGKILFWTKKDVSAEGEEKKEGKEKPKEVV